MFWTWVIRATEGLESGQGVDEDNLGSLFYFLFL